MMAEAGWDPMQLGIFFTKLNQAGGQRPMEFLSDHPNPDHREAAIEAEVKAMPTRTYGYETGDFAKVKQFIVPSAPAMLDWMGARFAGDPVSATAAPDSAQVETCGVTTATPVAEVVPSFTG